MRRDDDRGGDSGQCDRDVLRIAHRRWVTPDLGRAGVGHDLRSAVDQELLQRQAESDLLDNLGEGDELVVAKEGVAEEFVTREREDKAGDWDIDIGYDTQ